MQGTEAFRDRLTQWLSDRPDDHILRWLFGVMVTASVVVVGLDYVRMLGGVEQAALERNTPAMAPAGKPAAEPLPARRGDDGSRRGPLRVSDKQLAAAMTFELEGDGRLVATGTIMPGTADAFANEIGKRGSYVKAVVLHSPGGSVQDALRMGRLIREKKFDTEVPRGRYCASSCPLVFAGGVERRAGDNATIGVHQVFAAAMPAGANAGDGMDSAQRVSAECQKYLRDMGVDPAVWLHAMETPKHQLFHFKPDELLSLKLATQHGGKRPAATGRAS